MLGAFLHFGAAPLLGDQMLDRLHDLAPGDVGNLEPKHVVDVLEEAGRAVEDAAPVMARVVHALGGDEEARLRLELAVRRKRHPQRL